VAAHQKRHGFRGCLPVVSEWAAHRRRAEQADGALGRTPSARTIARLMTIGRDALSKSETVIVAVVEGRVPLLIEALLRIASLSAISIIRPTNGLDAFLQVA